MIRFALVFILVSLGGCTINETLECDPGFVDIDDMCVPMDGGPADTGPDAMDASPDAPDMSIGDAGPDAADAGDDAGPCGMECTGETPLCDTAAMMCVQCLAPSDCSGAADMCEAGSCVECTNNTHCTTAEASLCTVEMSCGACTMNADCDDIMDGVLSVCDTSGAAGVCVGCTSDADCGGNSCDPATNRCTETAVGSVQGCESCVADSECDDTPDALPAGEYACVPLNYMGDDRGGYCLKAANTPCGRPLSIGTADLTTLSGTMGDFCLPNQDLATCEAVRALLDDAACPGGMDSECPESGLCRTVGAVGGTPNRCTYPCGGVTECDGGGRPGSTCGNGGAAGVSYCGG